MTIAQHASMQPDLVFCLGKISQYPSDLEQDLLSHYPALKLGMEPDVSFFAKRLAPMAKNLIASTDIRCDWVVTASPFSVLPAAANLLSWKVYDSLREIADSSQEITLINLKLPRQRLAVTTEQEFKIYFEYSNNTIQDRVKEREKLHQGSDYIAKHRKNFCDRGIIVINDIRVTGTQQQFMQKAFSQVKPSCIYWLYVIEVDEVLGRSNPRIEHEINTSKLNTVEEFSKIICSDNIHYTARCVSRFFSHDLPQFKFLIEQLSESKQAIILDLASREGRYDGEMFAEKMQLLASLNVSNA